MLVLKVRSCSDILQFDFYVSLRLGFVSSKDSSPNLTSLLWTPQKDLGLARHTDIYLFLPQLESLRASLMR